VNVTPPVGFKADVTEKGTGRGDREINIVLSELVAGEMGKYGSPANRAMNRGARPMVRR